MQNRARNFGASSSFLVFGPSTDASSAGIQLGMPSSLNGIFSQLPWRTLLVVFSSCQSYPYRILQCDRCRELHLPCEVAYSAMTSSCRECLITGQQCASTLGKRKRADDDSPPHAAKRFETQSSMERRDVTLDDVSSNNSSVFLVCLILLSRL